MTSSTATRTAWLQIHLCVVLWGFTAIIGKLISLPALPLVWWRMLLVVALLMLLPRVWRGLRAMSARLRWSYAGVGVLVALHWLTFYASIKLSNASVGATCMALATVFTALIEPVLTGKRLSKREVGLGMAAVGRAVDDDDGHRRGSDPGERRAESAAGEVTGRRAITRSAPSSRHRPSAPVAARLPHRAGGRCARTLPGEKRAFS